MVGPQQTFHYRGRAWTVKDGHIGKLLHVNGPFYVLAELSRGRVLKHCNSGQLVFVEDIKRATKEAPNE